MIGSFVGGALGLLGYSLVKILRSGQKKSVQEQEQPKTVKVADPTKQHLTSLDRLMELLGTTNDDRAMDLAGCVTFIAISKKEESEKRVGLRKLVVEAIAELRVRPKYRKLINFCEESNKLDELADVLTQYFICKNPLQKAELATVELKDVEDNLIYDSMLKSYKSVGLTAARLIQKSSSRAVEKLVLENKVKDFLAARSGSDEIIRRKNIVKFFGSADLDKAWEYMRSNRDVFMATYNVKIALRDSGKRGFEGDHSFFDELFVTESGPAVNDEFFQATAKVRKDLKSCVVLQNSIARFAISKSYDQHGIKTGKTPHSDLRAKLIAEGVWERVENGYRFTRDYEFGTTSLAGNIVCGMRVSGHTTWLMQGTNITLKEHIDNLQNPGSDAA